MTTGFRSVDDSPDKSGGEHIKDGENTHRQRVTFEIADHNSHETP